MGDSDYTYDLSLLEITRAQTKNEPMYFKQKEALYTLSSKPLKFVDLFN